MCQSEDGKFSVGRTSKFDLEKGSISNQDRRRKEDRRLTRDRKRKEKRRVTQVKRRKVAGRRLIQEKWKKDGERKLVEWSKSKKTVHFADLQVVEDPDCSYAFSQQDEARSLPLKKTDCIEDSPSGEVSSLIPDEQLTVGDGTPEITVHLAKLEPAKMMTIPVFIGGIEYMALVDTGASVNLVKEGIFQEQEESGEKTCPAKLKGLGTLPIQPISKQQGRFSIGPLMFEESFLVLPESSLGYAVILGNPFFLSNKIKVEFPRKLSGPLSSGYWEYYAETRQVVVGEIEVFLQDSQSLSSAPKLVTAFIDPNIGDFHDQEFYFEASIHRNVSSRVSGESGIVQFVGNSCKILLEVDTDESSSKFIRKNTRVGYLSSIVELEADTYDVCTCMSQSETVGGETTPIVDVSHLDSAQGSQVMDMISRRSAALSTGDHDIGCAGITSHRIELHDTTPIRIKKRRFSEVVTDEIERQCEELRELDVIQYSKSPWSAPVVPITKKDGSLRLCIDYRKLNSVTKADRFPMPNMTDMVFSLRGTKYFTTLDLVRGYYQVPLDPATSEVTAFSTANNHYEFKRLAFGLKNAPAAFQREMRAVLKDFDSKEVVVYIDDILVLGSNFEEHIKLVAKVLDTLIAYGMKVKPIKCNWFQSEVQFLGHVVSSEGVRKSAEYTKSVVEFPRPQTVKQLRSFMGLVNFQRKFIANCSVISRPLNMLLKMNDKTRLDWTNEMQDSFQNLKTSMVEDIQLVYPDYSHEASSLEIATDASMSGAGASLSQVQDGQVRVIAYASTTFNPAQRNYSTIEQELEAIRWAVSVFRHFILGVPFLLHTDHRPLVYMANMTKCNSRIMRTFHELSEYDFLVKYRPGKANAVADTLSRISQDQVGEECLFTDKIPDGLKCLSTVEGGPDALVTSLWECLQHHRGEHAPDLLVPSDADSLRRDLATEIKDSAQLYGVGKQDRRFKTKMWSYPGCLPPPQFIEAFCNLFKLEVWEHHNFGLPVVHLPGHLGVSSMELGKRIHLQSKAGVHFNPLRETKLYKPEMRLLRGPTEMVLPKDTPSYLEEQNPSLEDKMNNDVELSCNVASIKRNCSCNRNPLNGMVTASINIAGMDVCAVIDSGAQISLMSAEVWEAMDSESKEACEHSAEVVNLKSLGGSSVSTHGCISVDWSFSAVDMRHTTTFAIVASDVMPACVLIGANIIERLHIDINYANNCICMGDIEVAKFSLGTFHLLSVQYCLTQDEFSIPENYIILPGLNTKLTDENLKDIQCSDKGLRKLLNLVKKGVKSKIWPDCLRQYKPHADKIGARQDLLVHTAGEREVVLLSKDFLTDLAMRTHLAMTHPGKNKLLALMKKYCWHPSLVSIVSDVCYSCEKCQKNKVTPQHLCPPITKLEMTRPFELVSADLVQLPRTRQGHVGCFVVVDHLTKWASVCPIKNKRGDTIANCLLHKVLPSLPRVPERILTDNGPEFISASFEEVLQSYGIYHSYSTPHKPAANGAVERLNRTLIEMIRSECSDSEEWDACLPRVILNYNNSVHSSTGFTPSENLLSRPHSLALVRNKENNDVKKAYWKPSHPSFQSFKVGDWVLKKVYFQGHLCTNKLKPRYEGPYQIFRTRKNGVSYVLKNEANEEIRAHHSQLKRHVVVPKYLEKVTYPDHEMLGTDEITMDVTSDYSTDSEEDFNDYAPETSSTLLNLPTRRVSRGVSDFVLQPIEKISAPCMIPDITIDKPLSVKAALISGEIPVDLTVSNRVDVSPVSPARVIEGTVITHRSLPFSNYVDEVISNKYQPVPLITNQEVTISRCTEFYRLLSVTQEIVSNQSRALLDLSVQIQEDIDNLEDEFSRSSLHLRLSPLNATQERSNSSKEADSSSDSASLLTLLNRLKEKLTPAQNSNSPAETESALIIQRNGTSNNFSSSPNLFEVKDRPLNGSSPSSFTELPRNVDHEVADVSVEHDLNLSNITESTSQKTVIPVTPRYFTRSRGPAPAAPHVLAKPI